MKPVSVTIFLLGLATAVHAAPFATAEAEKDNPLIASGAYGIYKRGAEAEKDNPLIDSNYGLYGEYKRDAEAEAEKDNPLIASGAYGTYKRDAEATKDNPLIADGAYGTY